MQVETNSADALDTALAQLCDEQRLVALSARQIEAAKQDVIRLVRDRFGQKSTQPRAYIKILRPDSVDQRDDEDELEQTVACEQLKRVYAQRPDTDEWRLWLYLWARRVDEALVRRVPAFNETELDRIGAALMQVHTNLLLFDHRNSEFLLSGKRLSVALAQQAQKAKLIFVQLRSENGALSLLGITRAGLLYHFAHDASGIPSERLYAVARNLGLAVKDNALQYVPIAASVPFDAVLLLYIVGEGARLAPRGQFAQLVRWVEYVDADTLALFHSHVVRTHYLTYFLGERPQQKQQQQQQEVMEIEDSSAHSQQSQPAERAAASVLTTSVTQLITLLQRDEDVGDSVLQDVVKLVIRPRETERHCIADPMDWHNKVVLLGRAINVSDGCDLTLVPINHKAHWSLLLLTPQHAWYYSSVDGDAYARTVKKKVRAAMPALPFDVIQGPVQGVDRECALYVLNMMQYALDGNKLEENVVLTRAQRKYTRKGVHATLVDLLRESLVRENVVAFCVDELINFWRQDQVQARDFVSLMKTVLSAFPALSKAVAELAPGKARARDALTRELLAKQAITEKPPPAPRRTTLVIEDTPSVTDEEQEEEIVEEIEPEEPVLPAANEPDEHAQRYDMSDPVDELVTFLAEIRDETHAELSGKYKDATLWDSDFLGSINETLQRLAYSDAVQKLIRRSVDALFYDKDRRNQRAYLQWPSDEQIKSELARYRMYKK